MNDTSTMSLEKTQIVAQLCQVPQVERDAVWKSRFLDCIATASMATLSSQVIVGPDGFAYFALTLPEQNAEFESFSIKQLLPFLHEHGYGVAINATEKGADWVFSFGDIWNYSSKGVFYKDLEQAPSEETGGEISGEVLVAQPSVDFLPEQVREKISEVLAGSFGIRQPSVLLLSDPKSKPEQSLAFNVFRKDFDDTDEGERAFEHAMSFVSWSLPRHYGLVVLDKENNLTEHFQPLSKSILS